MKKGVSKKKHSKGTLFVSGGHASCGRCTEVFEFSDFPERLTRRSTIDTIENRLVKEKWKKTRFHGWICSECFYLAKALAA